MQRLIPQDTKLVFSVWWRYEDVAKIREALSALREQAEDAADHVAREQDDE